MLDVGWKQQICVKATRDPPEPWDPALTALLSPGSQASGTPNSYQATRKATHPREAGQGQGRRVTSKLLSECQGRRPLCK